MSVFNLKIKLIDQTFSYLDFTLPSNKNFAVKIPKYGINLKFHSNMSSLTFPQIITICIRLALLMALLKEMMNVWNKLKTFYIVFC